MDVHLTLDSASADIKIAGGHAKNRNLDGQKRCLDAAATRIDAVVDYAIGLGLVVPSRAMDLMLDCMNGYDDYHDSVEMLAGFAKIPNSQKFRNEPHTDAMSIAYWKSIEGLPNAGTMGLI